jgi:antitoxin CptB
MNIKINKTKWKCRRGLRELDLLFRRYSDKYLTSLSEDDFKMFNSILDIEDQPLYDFIFKNDSLNNPAQEKFILKNLKNFKD